MLQDNKPIGVQPSIPGIVSEIGGAPVSTPGGNDGTDKTKMSGTSVATTANPPSPAATTDTEHETPGLSPEQQQRVDATAGTDRQIRTVKDWMEAEENRPETPQEREKRERKERSKRIIAAVSDGMSALSNLFFTTQYAPNMYNHEKGSMSTAVGRHLDALKAEREKKRDQYINYSLKLGDLENQRAATLRELEAQQERQKLAREKAQREAEEHGWNAALQPDKQREQKGKADKSEQDAITAKAVAEAAPELQQAKIATERARKGSLDASAANSRASAGEHNRSGYYGTFMGVRYDNERDYSKAVYQAARDYNTRHADEGEKDEKGNIVRPPVPVEWQKSTGWGEEPVLYKAYDVAAQLEPLLERERRNGGSGKGSTSSYANTKKLGL